MDLLNRTRISNLVAARMRIGQLPLKLDLVLQTISSRKFGSPRGRNAHGSFLPTLDKPNVQSLQLLIVTPEGKVETETADTLHSIELQDEGRSLSYRQVNRARN